MSEDVAEYEFDLGFQDKIAHLLLRDGNFAGKVKDLVKPEYFTNAATGAVVRIVLEHFKVYKSIPDMRIMPAVLKDEIAKKRIRPDMVKDVIQFVQGGYKADISNPNFVTDKVVDFAKHQATEQAMMQCMPLIEKKDWDGIAKIMAEAHQVGAVLDGGGYDYFAEIENRTQRRHDLNAGKIILEGIPTGIPAMDALLKHGGWGRKELAAMMGAPKAGKSMSLGFFAKNASLMGYNVFYPSCEVAKEIIADRLDAAIADTMINKLNMDPDAVAAAIKRAHAKAGHFELRDYATGLLKPSQLHRIIDQYRADGIIFDLVTPDYADIMAAEYRSDNLQENLRSIYIDLRGLAHETNTAFLTATQTNRDGAKANTAKMTDVGDDINKVRTVDLLIGINANDAEKADGICRLFWAASRNSEDGFTLTVKQDRAKMQFITKVLGKS